MNLVNPAELLKLTRRTIGAYSDYVLMVLGAASSAFTPATAGQPSLIWRKSRASGNTNCVEVAKASNSICVRDSKNITDVDVLSFSKDTWQAFVGAIQAGELDRPTN